jgi:molybdopterin-binding protein
MKFGARNQFVGEVVEIKKGSLMCQVTLKAAGGALVSSVMTLDSLKDLGIKKGSRVRAVVKAVNVLLTRDE